MYKEFIILPVRKEKIFLITAYPKNVKDNLSKAERNNIKQLVEILKSSV